MSEKQPVILPPKYYLEYFEYLISFIEKHAPNLLGSSSKAFIETFRSLTTDARCLLIRMANRKGLLFRLEKLQYKEIENIGRAAETLVETSMASLDPIYDPILFTLFTKSELHGLFPEREFKSKSKEVILLELFEATREDYLTIYGKYSVLQFLKQPDIEFLKLLFFGHTHEEMTEFVIRDVGHVKLENLEGHSFTPWFESHDEAMAVFELSEISRTFWEMRQIYLPEEVDSWLATFTWSHWFQYPQAQKKGDRLMLRIGEYFEKSNLLEASLPYYELSRKHPARERRVRIYEKLGRNEEALTLAQELMASPLNATELLFASDFISKKSKRNYRSTTQKLKDNPGIVVQAEGQSSVEQKALVYLEEQGFEGSHTENYLWRSLFGLFFWEELFNPDLATFHHPLQRMPSDLHEERFFELRKLILQDKLNSIKSKKQLKKVLINKYHEKHQINNPLVSWHPSTPGLLEKCVDLIPLIGLKEVLFEISKNIKYHSAGFPDLFVWKEKDYHFYEIKSPNDHLSAQQLFWLDFFEKHKIKASILRVYYE